MNSRKLVSLSMAISFLILAVSGILSYFMEYNRILASVHTVFGFIFVTGALFHFRNNFHSLQKYIIADRLKNKSITISTLIIGAMGMLYLAYNQKYPVKTLMDWSARQKQLTQLPSLDRSNFTVYEMKMDGNTKIEMELLSGEHFWHPQIAIWLEDTSGTFLQNIFVTKATATGSFYGGRNKDNFKEFDQSKAQLPGDYRRVDALPYWSHKRGITYSDGFYVPPSNQILADGTTGATPDNHFILRSSVPYSFEKFRVNMEINVAFDDNEYYSEYDFPDDEIYHNGTGQLGQPSLIYSADIDMSDEQNYYLMKLKGHGHHSARNGEIFSDLSKLTTALEIVERIILKVERRS